MKLLDPVFRGDYSVGVSIAYPIGRSIEDANHARSRLERDQAIERVKGAQGRVIQQVRDAGWKVEMNAKRIETSRATRELAEQRLDAERRRFEVSTLVILSVPLPELIPRVGVTLAAQVLQGVGRGDTAHLSAGR